MAEETLAQEFQRLVHEYHEADDGDRSTKEEAWNLIADFAIANCEAVFDGLNSLKPRGRK